jgi:hypothetical protein
MSKSVKCECSSDEMYECQPFSGAYDWLKWKVLLIYVTYIRFWNKMVKLPGWPFISSTVREIEEKMDTYTVFPMNLKLRTLAIRHVLLAARSLASLFLWHMYTYEQMMPCRKGDIWVCITHFLERNTVGPPDSAKHVASEKRKLDNECGVL